MLRVDVVRGASWGGCASCVELSVAGYGSVIWVGVRCRIRLREMFGQN